MQDNLNALAKVLHELAPWAVVVGAWIAAWQARRTNVKSESAKQDRQQILDKVDNVEAKVDQVHVCLAATREETAAGLEEVKRSNQP